MKIIKKVPTSEVKCCFIVSNLIKKPRKGQRYLDVLSVKEFEDRLANAKKKVRSFSSKRIDELVGERYRKRLTAYNASEWYLAIASPRELGVWKRAGNLPTAWTRGSVADTANEVKKGLVKGMPVSTKRHRAGRAIPSMLSSSVLNRTQKEKYLLPIGFAAGTGTNGRRGLRKYKGDLDDGCMRSIALAVTGRKKLRLYLGVPKKNIARAHK